MPDALRRQVWPLLTGITDDERTQLVECYELLKTKVELGMC